MADPTEDTELQDLDEEASPADGDWLYLATDEGSGNYSNKKLNVSEVLPQTGAEIKTAYEAESNTNAFTDAEKTLLGNQSGTNTGDEVVASTAEVSAGSNNTKMVTPSALDGSSPELDTLTLATKAIFDGSSSGTTELVAAAVAAGVLTLPAITDTLAGLSNLLTVETGSFTRAVDAADATVDYATSGTPIAVFVISSNTTSLIEGCFGFSDGVADYSMQNMFGYSIITDNLVRWDNDAGGALLCTGTLNSTDGGFAEDKFSIKWVKTGSTPSETLTCRWIALIGKDK